MLVLTMRDGLTDVTIQFSQGIVGDPRDRGSIKGSRVILGSQERLDFVIFVVVWIWDENKHP